MQGVGGYDSFAAGPSRIVIDLNNSLSSTHELSPSDDQPLSGHGSAKKRNITRACDACRRRKTKCDGPKMPDNVCSNCLQSHKPCTYVEASKPRGPPKAYVTGLEDRLERLEALLNKLRPNEDFSDELGPPVIRDSWKTGEAVVEHHMLPRRNLSPSLPSIIPSLGSLKGLPIEPKQISIGTPSPPPNALSGPSSSDLRNRVIHIKTESDDNGPHLVGEHESATDTASSSASEEFAEFSAGLSRLTLRGTEVPEDDANQLRYHGHSSQITFAEAAKKFKERQAQEAKSTGTARPGPQAQQSTGASASSRPIHTPVRRPEFWRTPPWELTWEGVIHESTSFLSPFLPYLPPSDLAQSLMDIYFLHVNMQFPLLHRPTFERYWKEGLARRDVWFACLCFALFAVSSRWSEDPRVLPESASSTAKDHIWHQAGLTYFNAAMEITRLRRSLFNPGCLFEIQSVFLLANYLRGTPNYPTGWLFISIGIRKSQDLGAHRKSMYKDPPSVEEEQWRRVYWLMIALDRVGSAALGRPAVVAEADFDVDLPLEVDDEYWENEDPSLAFKQPPDQPSTVAFFNSWVKLSQIVAFATKTIYAVNKSKVFIGANSSRWPEEVLKQMNKALGEFLESVPAHLKWSPDIEDEIFANQSASLHTTYYLTQILIHRPFTSPDLSPSSPSLHAHSQAPAYESPALALNICTSAAKACARILEVQIPKGFSSVPNLINCSHICAATLLMKVWDIKSQAKNRPSGLSTEDSKEIQELIKDTDIFMKVLESLEPRWEIVPTFLNMLRGSLPSLDTDEFNVPPPFRQPLSTNIDPPPALPVSKHSHPVASMRQEVPSSFENGWQWYASASLPATTPQNSSMRSTYGDHFPPANTQDGVHGSPMPNFSDQYSYGFVDYTGRAPDVFSTPPSYVPQIEMLQYYYPPHATPSQGSPQRPHNGRIGLRESVPPRSGNYYQEYSDT